MESQVKGARAKQKNYAKSRRGSDRDERKTPSPVNETEQHRRLFNKRATARFAKGPSDTGGFTYPRRRLVIEEPDVESSLVALTVPEPQPAVEVSPANEPIELLIVAQIVDENLLAPEPVLVSSPEPEPEPVLENEDKHGTDEETLISKEVKPTEECVPLQELTPESSPTPTKTETEETPDDTVGPGDRSSSDSSEEESDVETIEPAPVVPIRAVKPVSKPITPPPPPVVVRKIVTPVSPYRKVVATPTPTPRSSWSRFLPLVIEIKATIPYPMHLLGFFLLFITALLLRLLYQFGADLGGEMDLQGQFIRLAKLAFLFVVVAICVNFVEDNKEPPHKDSTSPAPPRLRPSKITKNKKKMMLKV